MDGCECGTILTAIVIHSGLLVALKGSDTNQHKAISTSTFLLSCYITF
jgi:hypothetical protein